MSNFLRGMGSVFNIFPQTDYMAMVPKEGELLDQAAKDVYESFNLAFDKQTEAVDGGKYIKEIKRKRDLLQAQ